MISLNTKLLALFSFLVIFLGFVFLWFGLTSSEETIPQQLESEETIQIASDSAKGSDVIGIEGERVIVSRVIDGDTFEIEDGLKVRMLGVDTPETVDVRKPVGCFGKEASSETKKLLSRKLVILQKDISNTDKYNRLLRYVFLPL